MDNSWLKKRNCGIHMTIRDVDCKNFDAEDMARRFFQMGVNFFSFFAGGYITTYPSKLEDSRLSPFLDGQDVTGDIINAAHKYGIKAIAMCDLSVISYENAKKHPEWLAVDKDGKPFYSAGSDSYRGCVMGGYANDYGRAMTREIIENYEIDGIKFGGGSYGFQYEICHCDNCKKSYGKDIPLKMDWNDPQWLSYHEWRTVQTSKRVKYLNDMVKLIRPDMPVMGNGVCFSDINWTTNSALDMEDMAAHQDMIQIEAQTRCQLGPDMNNSWQTITWAGEEANFMTSITDKPIWVVVSYFRAWPWRRSAMEYAEQKIYLAQIAANGASPMVNLAGGPPKVHEDQRGFQACSEIWRFIRDNNEYFTNDYSGADVALLSSQDCMIKYGKNDMNGRYLQSLRGYENALIEHQIPFVIISPTLLNANALSKYKTVILPNYAYMSDENCQAIKEYKKAGGNVIGTFECSLYNEKGDKRDNLGLADVFHVDYTGEKRNVDDHDIKAYRQSYGRIKDINSDLLSGIEDTTVVPALGEYLIVKEREGAQVPLRLTAPFIIFPEGLSYTTDADIDHPYVIMNEDENGSRSVYFAGMYDKLNSILNISDISAMLANAVKWTLNGKIAATAEGPETLYLTLREQPGRAMVHLINLTGGRRYIARNIPLHGLEIYVAKKGSYNYTKAFLLSDKRSLEMRSVDGGYKIKLDKLIDYDVIVLE